MLVRALFKGNKEGHPILLQPGAFCFQIIHAILAIVRTNLPELLSVKRQRTAENRGCDLVKALALLGWPYIY